MWKLIGALFMALWGLIVIIAGVIWGLIISFVSLAISAMIAGTIVYYLWPIVLPATIPGILDSGLLVGSLSWLNSVFLMLLVGTIFKTGYTTSKGK